MKDAKDKDQLEPLPELDGYVPDGWKDAVMCPRQDRSLEDQRDVEISEARKNEPTVSWESLKVEAE